MKIMIRSFRATPRTITGVALAKLLFSQDIQIQLPQISASKPNQKPKSAFQKDQIKKAKMKAYADTKHNS